MQIIIKSSTRLYDKWGEIVGNLPTTGPRTPPKLEWCGGGRLKIAEGYLRRDYIGVLHEGDCCHTLPYATGLAQVTLGPCLAMLGAPPLLETASIEEIERATGLTLELEVSYPRLRGYIKRAPVLLKMRRYMIAVGYTKSHIIVHDPLPTRYAEANRDYKYMTHNSLDRHTLSSRGYVICYREPDALRSSGLKGNHLS